MVRKKRPRKELPDHQKPGPVRKLTQKEVNEYGRKMREEQRAPVKKTAPSKNQKKHVVKLAPNIGPKNAMEMLADAIKAQGRKPPHLNLTLRNPAHSFLVEMYDEFARWSKKALGEFISEVTGRKPEATDVPSMLGQMKRILHSLFLDETPDRDAVLSYDSVWKVWPYIRRKPGKEGEDEVVGEKLATKKKVVKKGPRSKAASKKKVSRKASTKKTPVSKKKAAKKAATRKSNGLSDTTKIKAVDGSGEPKMAKRRKIKEAVPKSGITVGDLKSKTGCTASTIKAMIGKGFLEEVG